MSEIQGPPPGQWQQPPPAGQWQPPPTAQPTQPPKKSKTGLIIGCCSGCALFMALICGTGGYLFYLEEGVEMNEPGDEIATSPIGPIGYSVTFIPEGNGYASYDIWIEVTGQKDGTTSIQELASEGTCTGGNAAGYPRTTVVQLDGYHYAVHGYRDTGLPGQFTAWIKINDEYLRNDGVQVMCNGTFRMAGWQLQQGRVIVTRRQRPSDWLG